MDKYYSWINIIHGLIFFMDYYSVLVMSIHGYSVYSVSRLDFVCCCYAGRVMDAAGKVDMMVLCAAIAGKPYTLSPQVGWLKTCNHTLCGRNKVCSCLLR
jgi:hypothetical protein